MRQFRVLVLRRLLFAILACLLPHSATAAVQISFYSHEWGNRFPHAFIKLAGVDDRTGRRIDASYGFTATRISPAILARSVKGEISKLSRSYIARSDEHFRLTLTDVELDAVLATVKRWRSLKQPSYSLARQNCVFFVADIAASLGMKAETPGALMIKPRSYTEALIAANRNWLLARRATLVRSQSATRQATKR